MEQTSENPVSASDRTAPNKMKLTRPALDKLLRTCPHRQHIIWDTEQDGFGVLVSRGPADKQQATVSLRVCYYMKGKPGKPRYFKFGRYPDGEYSYKDRGKEHRIPCSNIDALRGRASVLRENAKRHGMDPHNEDGTESDLFADVVKNFLELHAKKRRAYKETERIFNRYVLPEWGNEGQNLKIGDIKKKTVAHLLDKIELGRIKHTKKYKSGKTETVKIGTAKQATAVLAQLTILFNWHAARDDDFLSPVVRKMRRSKHVKRQRSLNDDEIRAMWASIDENEDLAIYGAMVKCALLLPQRFRKVGKMLRHDLNKTKQIPSYMDEEGNYVPEFYIGDVWDPSRKDDPANKLVGVMPLPPMARAIIDSVPVIDGEGDFVFSLNGDKPINGEGRYKRRLDKAMLAKLREWAKVQGRDPESVTLEPWQHRDLRRTARTLMPRAGVDKDIAERCLAHKMPVIEDTYDTHTYLREKRNSFAKLAAFVERILNPTTANVVTLPQRA